MNAQEIQQKYGILGTSTAIQEILQVLQQVAPTELTILITGESGTGKEVIAKAIHKASKRATQPMLTVNCGAIPEGIIESELFGHEKGAFTGAGEFRKGYFELADGGTIFLDEIGEVPPEMQVALLRVLQVFAQHQLNLSKIESRPTKQLLGEYVFYLDVEGMLVNNALQQLKQYTAWLRILGTYPALGTL